MVVDESAKIVAYFFTSPVEAGRIIAEGKDSARKEWGDGKGKDKDIDPREIWKSATLSTLPLSSVLSLSLQGRTKSGVYFKMAPTESDLQDALNYTSIKGGLPDGKVPLFFSDDLAVPLDFYDIREGGWKRKAEDGGETFKPIFFSRKELEEAWGRYGGEGKGGLKVEVTELTGVVKEIINGKDPELGRLGIVPYKGSKEREKKVRGKGIEYKLGERILIL